MMRFTKVWGDFYNWYLWQTSIKLFLEWSHNQNHSIWNMKKNLIKFALWNTFSSIPSSSDWRPYLCLKVWKQMEQTAGIRITICNKISGILDVESFSQSEKRICWKRPIKGQNWFLNLIILYLQANIVFEI